MARTRTYNPGVPTAAVKIGENRFAIDSFRSEAAAYVVDTSAGTCTCPHFTGRLAAVPGAECKHLLEVRRQKPFIEAAEKARTLSDSDLARLTKKYVERGNPIIAGALMVEKHRRQQAEAADARLKAVFA